MKLLSKLRTRWDYTFDTAGFRPNPSAVSAEAIATAKTIRGENRPPTLFLHGMMPRSGSVYTGNLLKIHQDITPYPFDLWEVPFLQQSGKIRGVQSGFERAYQPGAGTLQNNDFLCLFGASFVAHMHSQVPASQRMLLKMAGIHYLDNFFDAFPHEHLLLVVRDGRDVVRSTLNSWPSLGFINVCRRWNQSARLALHFDKNNQQRAGYKMFRFEDILPDPAAFIRTVSAEFDLPLNQYDFSEIDKLPIRGSSSLKENGSVTWQAIEKPKAFNPIGGWQQWPNYKKAIFKKIAGQTMIDLGYTKDNNW